MHKSKYMNMAGDMAMTKLMPKPDISITISMAGGVAYPLWLQE